MKIEVDIKDIVENIDVSQVVEEKIKSDIIEKIDEVTDDVLDNEEVINNINKKAVEIINEYISSEEGKDYIIEAFKNTISNSDILASDDITELIAEFLKKKLNI